MNRWKNLLGRGGTVLISINLALLLVSLIPQTVMSSSKGVGAVPPEQIQIAFNARNLNPQQEIEVAVSVEGTLKVYLLEINLELQFAPATGFDYRFNLTDFQELLNEHPDQIIWEHEIVNGDYERSYTPTGIVNATVVFYNPTSESASVEHAVALKSSLAPGEKVRTIAYWATPIGILLMIPWLAEIWKYRKQI